jgi:hypothetical protein
MWHVQGRREMVKSFGVEICRNETILGIWRVGEIIILKYKG